MPISHFAEKYTPMQVMVIGAILMAAGLIGFSFVNGWMTAIVSIILLTLGEILIFPSNSLMIDQLAPDHLRGTYFGAGGFRKIGNFLGPVFGGYLLSHYHGQIMLWIITVVTLGSIFFFLTGNKIYVKTRISAEEKSM